jgi:serine/threonine-protein kinase ATR
LVDAAEIGNEPGDWSDADYSRLFRAMAEGLREGDPKLQIATCNLTTGKSGRYEKSVSCIAPFPQLYDVLNVHSYAQLENWPTWRRSFPEDPRLPKYLPDVEAVCRWRDTNAPGKPVWLTEFGYDSSTKPAPATGDGAKWVGVTDEQQAQWLVRSLLVFSAMPIERAFIYFFDDKDQPGFHASSGITRNFQPKPSFHALAHLQRVLGDYRFHQMVTNVPGQWRVQEYQSGSDPRKFVWAVWSPTGEGRTNVARLQNFPGRLVSAERMPLSANVEAESDRSLRMNAAGIWRFTVSESPLYLFFEGR